MYYIGTLLDNLTTLIWKVYLLIRLYMIKWVLCTIEIMYNFSKKKIRKIAGCNERVIQLLDKGLGRRWWQNVFTENT